MPAGFHTLYSSISVVVVGRQSGPWVPSAEESDVGEVRVSATSREVEEQPDNTASMVEASA